jgi:hypothetical protein
VSLFDTDVKTDNEGTFNEDSREDTTPSQPKDFLSGKLCGCATRNCLRQVDVSVNQVPFKCDAWAELCFSKVRNLPAQILKGRGSNKVHDDKISELNV